ARAVLKWGKVSLEVGTLIPSVFKDEARQVDQTVNIRPVEIGSHSDRQPGADSQSDIVHNPAESRSASHERTPRVMDRLWSIQGDLDIFEEGRRADQIR